MQLKLKDEYLEQLTFTRPDALVEPSCSLCRQPLSYDDAPSIFWSDDDNGACVTLCDACAGKAVEVVQ